MKDRTDRLARFTSITALMLASVAMATWAALPQPQNPAPETPYHKTDPLKPPGPPVAPPLMTTRLPSRPTALVNIRILPASIELVSPRFTQRRPGRSEEHTSELQSQSNLVCRLLLEKKKKKKNKQRNTKK